MSEDGLREIESARENQETPEVAQMYAQISIAISLVRIADAAALLAETVVDRGEGDIFLRTEVKNPY